MTRLERVVELIANSMNEDIKSEEERFDFKFDRTNMKDYLEEIRWGMSSGEFKEEVRYLVTEHDNDLYRNGYVCEELYISMNDDCEVIDNDGRLYTYRQIMNFVRKKVFKNNNEEGEE